ncbi:MAG: hypothetical protein ACRBM6_25365 [Geminicoccales bacterium]
MEQSTFWILVLIAAGLLFVRQSFRLLFIQPRRRRRSIDVELEVIAKNPWGEHTQPLFRIISGPYATIEGKDFFWDGGRFKIGQRFKGQYHPQTSTIFVGSRYRFHFLDVLTLFWGIFLLMCGLGAMFSAR